jgi:hypothetical protein
MCFIGDPFEFCWWSESLKGGVSKDDSELWRALNIEKPVLSVLRTKCGLFKRKKNESECLVP